MSKDRHIRDHYEPRITPERETYDILDWGSAASQRARFGALADNVDLAGKSILDVGCGLGDLLAFLADRGLETNYTGVDIVAKMIAAARQRQPAGRFICADLFTAETPDEFAGKKFDVVFCSGTFNLDLGNNRRFLPRAVGRLLELACEYVVFNLLHDRADDKYDHCAYFDPAEVLTVLHPMADDIRLIDDYLHNDFTVICRPRRAD